MPLMRSFVRVLAAAALLGASACSAAPADTGEVPGLYLDLSDFKIVSDHATVPAGRTVFGIRNHASMSHEVKVIKTDLEPDKLPIDGASAKASEDGKVGELLNISAGGARKLVLELVPGRYVLICNIAGHYQLGMRLALEVR